MIELTKEQKQAVAEGRPVEFCDGDQIFYVVSKDVYDRIRLILDAEDIDPSFFEFDEASNS